MSDPEDFSFRSRKTEGYTWRRDVGDYTALVQAYPDWGFTIWDGGRCVAGRCDDEWTAGDAANIAGICLELLEDLMKGKE
jgi:hypothetical protein